MSETKSYIIADWFNMPIGVAQNIRQDCWIALRVYRSHAKNARPQINACLQIDRGELSREWCWKGYGTEAQAHTALSFQINGVYNPHKRWHVVAYIKIRNNQIQCTKVAQ